MRKEITRRRKINKLFFCMLMSILLLLCGCNEEKIKEEPRQQKEEMQENVEIVEQDDSRNIYGTNYDLEYVKSFNREDVFWSDGAFLTIADRKYKMVSELGEDIGDIYFKSIVQLSYYYGNDYRPEKEMDYFVVEALNTKNVNRYGIYSGTGEEILSCEAGYIEALSDRYVKIMYATNKTDDENEAFLEDSESEEYYKGCIMIYDLEKRRFVPNIKIENKYVTEDEEYEIEIAGNVVIVNGNAYNEMGELIAREASASSSHNTFWTNTDNIYDKNGQIIFGEDVQTEFVSSMERDYFSYPDGEYNVLVDDEKKELYRQKNVEYEDVSDKYIVIQSTETKMYSVLNYDGSIILDNESRYVYLRGDYICVSDNGEMCAVYYGGTLLTEEPYSVEGNEAVYEKISDEKFRIIGLDGKSSIEVGESGSEIAPYLLSVAKYQSPGNVGLLDSHDCSLLLDFEYESINYMRGYILVEKENCEYDVYKLIKK